MLSSYTIESKISLPEHYANSKTVIRVSELLMRSATSTSSATAGVATFLPEIYARINSFRKLEYGWDAEGGEPIAPDSIEAARRLLDSLIRNAQTRRSLLESPSISPDGSGEIGIAWTIGSRFLIVRTNADNPSIMHVARREGKSTPIREEVELPGVAKYVDWVHGAA